MKKKAANEDAVKFIKSTAEELLKLLGIEGSIEVTDTSTDQEKGIDVVIEAEKETGLLIGAHGATLNSIQVFLGMAVRQKLGEWIRVVVNIGDWKEKQEEHLFSLAIASATRAKQTGETQRLYNLTPSQRRIIHMKLAEDSEIETESSGEGEERYLMVKAKQSAGK